MGKGLQEIREKKVIALQESHDRLHKEVITLQTIVALLQTENEGLKHQLKNAHSLIENEVALF